MTKDNIIYLKFRNENQTSDTIEILSCVVCKNKTFTNTYINSDYPTVKCAACGNVCGNVGWVDNELSE